jgi:fumarate hydratase class I
LDIQKFQESMYSLIVETSTNLPKDVRRAVKSAKQRENAGTRSALSLTTITNNITMADDNVSPGYWSADFQNKNSSWREPT